MVRKAAIITGIILLIAGFLFFFYVSMAEMQTAASDVFGLMNQRMYGTLGILKIVGFGIMFLGGLLLVLGFVTGNKEKVIIKQVVQSASQKFCSNCGKPITPEAKFCSNCAAKI